MDCKLERNAPGAVEMISELSPLLNHVQMDQVTVKLLIVTTNLIVIVWVIFEFQKQCRKFSE